MKNLENLVIGFLFFCLSQLNAQNGLERIIVEKYYISNTQDTLKSLVSGYLPVGSVTYRIYVDLLPEYRFYAAYGNENHELRIETSTRFFNNEDIGNTVPNVIPRRTLKKNTVMLDSWLSVGGAGEDYYGIPKDDDDTVETIMHEKRFLQNKTKSTGYSLTERDGLLAGINVPFPTFFGIDSIVPVFFNASLGSAFTTTNGAWGCLGGSIGVDSLGKNKILIAQLTTDGELSFELNIQIGKRGFSPELYVAKNPLGSEILANTLTYKSRQARLFSLRKKNSSTKNKNN